MRDRLAEDWVALWQSELTAMASDRELRESMAAMVALWASTAHAALGLLRAPYEHAPSQPTPGTTSAAQPPGSAPLAAAPQPRLDEVEHLNRRITELEQRLANFERNQPPSP
ncbi:MAG TPA: hypothetical protein PK231_05500 [Acidocella sp.]|nr:MAG: hypothetical protein B7Z77_10210 [Acidocella sp. 20-58-15]HQT38861.1 hypothetical protein [Acidocella sp.]